MNGKPVKIGLIGGMRAGKDTVAELIYSETIRGGNVHVMAFSTGITHVIEHYFPELLENGKPREAYQLIGQTFRKLNPDIWVNALLKEMEIYEMFDNPAIIVTDVRQPNEALALKENGFTLVKVIADTETRIARAKQAGDVFTADHLNHETELAVDQCDYDYLINNSGTLADLKLACKDLLLQMTVGGYEDFE